MPVATTMEGNDKLGYAAELIHQSPPGELADVLHGNYQLGFNIMVDIRSIFDDNDEMLRALHKVIRDKNIQNGARVVYELNGDKKPLLLSEHNSLEDEAFMDPESGARVYVNHFNLV